MFKIKLWAIELCCIGVGDKTKKNYTTLQITKQRREYKKEKNSDEFVIKKRKPQIKQI